MTLRRPEEMSFAQLVQALLELEHAEGELELEQTIERAAMERRLMRLLSKDDAPGTERRGTVRVSIPLQVKLFTPNRELTATLVDLAEGGLQVLSAAAPPDADTVEVELVGESPVLPADRQPARARARVSWTREQAGGFGLGLQFVSQPDGHRRRMRRLVLEILRRMPLAQDA